MAPANPKDDLLLIRCPTCGQRFNVEEELRGRMVECGECDHQFEIHDPVILRGKKFYPGERQDPLFDHITRVEQPLPRADDPMAPESFASQTIPVVIEPASPQRIVMGLIAVFALVITSLFMVLGATRGGILDGVPTDKRVLIAAFVAALSLGLLIYANPKTRTRMGLLGLLLGGGLISLPYSFTGGSKPLGSNDGSFNPDIPVIPEMIPDPTPMPMNTAQLKEFIGVGPLEEEIERLKNDGSPLKAVGLWLRKLNVRNELLVRDYIIRETDADLQSHLYPRGNGDYLMVVTGVDLSLEDLALIGSALGKLESLHHELKLIEVTVDNDYFVPGPIEVLTDPTAPDFFLRNKIELESIDLNRIKSAVKRLADVEPVLFHEDIGRRLLELLGSDWVDFKEDLCRALLTWSLGNGEAGKIALQEAKALRAKKKEVPEVMMDLIVHEKNLMVLPLLHEIWQENPARWEPRLRDIGVAAEKLMLDGYEDASNSLRQSSLRILASVGTAKSLPLLQSVEQTAKDVETRILAKKAIAHINKRTD